MFNLIINIKTFISSLIKKFNIAQFSDYKYKLLHCWFHIFTLTKKSDTYKIL